MWKRLKAWWAGRQKAKADRELDERIEVLLKRAKPMTTEQQRAQTRSFVKGNLALDGIHVSDEILAEAQRAAEETQGLPYIKIKQR